MSPEPARAQSGLCSDSLLYGLVRGVRIGFSLLGHELGLSLGCFLLKIRFGSMSLVQSVLNVVVCLGVLSVGSYVMRPPEVTSRSSAEPVILALLELSKQESLELLSLRYM